MGDAVMQTGWVGSWSVLKHPELFQAALLLTPGVRALGEPGTTEETRGSADASAKSQQNKSPGFGRIVRAPEQTAELNKRPPLPLASLINSGL